MLITTDYGFPITQEFLSIQCLVTQWVNVSDVRLDVPLPQMVRLPVSGVAQVTG